MGQYDGLHLTAEHIDVIRTALKEGSKHSADAYVCGWVEKPGDEWHAGVSIGLTIRMEGCDPDRVTKRVELPARARIERYGEAHHDAANRYAASHSHYAFEGRSALRTLAALVKVGDTLDVNFLLGNTNGYMKEAGLRGDSCTLIVCRHSDDIKYRILADIHVDHAIVPVTQDNGAYGWWSRDLTSAQRGGT